MEVCSVVEGCTNEVVDCIGGEIYYCAEHEPQAAAAYWEWQGSEERARRVIDQDIILDMMGWRAFLAGTWTRTPPTENGVYPLADTGGYNAGFITVSESDKDNLAWEGWYWSEKMPPMPPAPPILDD